MSKGRRRPRTCPLSCPLAEPLMGTWHRAAKRPPSSGRWVHRRDDLQHLRSIDASAIPNQGRARREVTISDVAVLVDAEDEVRDAGAPQPRPLSLTLRIRARQSEWFFLEPSASELAALATALREFRTVIRTRVPIGRGGNPHVADEFAVMPATRRAHRPRARPCAARGPRHGAPAVVGQGRPER